jgi:AcrR family transcriptional regulator
MPSITRRGRERSSRIGAEARLVDATERLLAEGTPYIALSVEQLCSEAGVARSTFYVHFRDKGELVTRVAALMLDQLSAAAEAWWVPGADRRELLVATRALIDVYARHRAVMTALTETAAYDGELRAVHQAMVDRHAEPLAALIEQGKRDGEVRELHTRETVVALVGMVQVACDRLADGVAADLDRLAEAITAIAWHALFPDEREAAGA